MHQQPIEIRTATLAPLIEAHILLGLGQCKTIGDIARDIIALLDTETKASRSIA